MITSLMMRHRTLHDTNTGLLDNLLSMTDQLESHRLELDELEANQTKLKLSINSQLSLKQKQQESELDRNQEKEQKFSMDKVDLRHQRSEFGQIMMAIDNLADKCRRRLDPIVSGMTLEDKLNIIKEYVVDMSDVSVMATNMSVEESSERKSASSKRQSQGKHPSKSS